MHTLHTVVLFTFLKVLTTMNLSLIIFSVLRVDVAVVVPGGDFHKVYLKPTQTAAIKKKCKLLLFF